MLEIIEFLFIIAIVALVLSVGIMSLPFIALFYLIKSCIICKKYRHLEPSEMECPNCHSHDVKIHSLRTGSQSQTYMKGYGTATHFHFLSQIFGSIRGKKTNNIVYTFKREAICQNCGFNYDYLTNEDVENIKQRNKSKLIQSIIFLVLAIMLNVGLVSYSNTHNKSSSNKTTVTTNTVNSNNSIWASDYTDISEFDYYLDGDQIYLKKYNGDSTKVKIKSSYEIEGKQYKVISFSEGVFAFKDVDSVILPDSLETMPDNTFNSCDLKCVYIPASLHKNKSGYAFYCYFHDVDTIYYGGNEEQWKVLTDNTDRKDIDAKQIKYNVNINDLK
jgi:hypothetical protein